MHIAIVQLSDIHFRLTKNPILSRVSQLAAAISSTDPSCTEYIILLSGDITDTGQQGEYLIAQQFLSDLSAAIREHRSTATIRYLAIPGNHDCDLPEAEIQLREALVQAIQPSLQKQPDASILDSLLKQQQHFLEFCEHIGMPTGSTNDRLCSRHILAVGPETIQVNLYNTALLSVRKEKPGFLSVPMDVVRSTVKLEEECSLSVSAFHHPYNWLETNVGLAFRTHVERTSDIVLTGHQHKDHGFAKQTVQGEHLFYSEGDVLQESDKPDHSGFRLILFDLANTSRRVVSYIWASSYYSSSADTGWQPYSRTSGFDVISATQEFLTTLSTSDIGLTHPIKGPVTLDAVFVYPDTTNRKLSSPDSTQDIGGANLLKHLTEKSRIIVQGEAYSGKTALAKTVIKDWLRDRAFYPLLLKGKDIKRADEAFIDRLLDDEAANCYGKQARERFRQLPPSAKVLVVDDWDDNPLASADRDIFLKRVELSFGKIVLFVDGVSYLQQVLAMMKGSEAILQFEHTTLHQMSYVARGQLIERWLGLAPQTDSGSFSRRVEETERLVKSVIGKNTLPSLPFIILSILQASEQNKDVLPENGSFGYLYEVLITTALNATRGEKPQLEKKYTFLSILAYWFFEGSTDIISESSLDAMLDEYSTSFMVKVDKATLLDDLAYAHVLVKRDGNYSFVFPHYFHYFLARYFKDNLHGQKGPTLRKHLKEIVTGLNVESNRTFLMFVMYLTHDDELTDELVGIGQVILAEFSPSDLTNEVEFYNSKPEAGIARAIPATVDLDASRRQRREAEDAALKSAEVSLVDTDFTLSVTNKPYSTDMTLDQRLEYARGCVEILGQVLRNFTGTLPGDRKLLILRTTYLLGLRILKAVLLSLGETTVKARAAMSEWDASKPEFAQLTKKIERLFTMLGQVIGVSIIRLISLSVGSPDIEGEAYTKTLEQVGRNNATQLIDLAIRLDHFESYPFKEIRDLHWQYRGNRFASMVLRDLVIANMHIFEIGREMRQRVLGELKTGNPSDPNFLSRMTKRFK